MADTTDIARRLGAAGDRPPTDYERAPTHDRMVRDLDTPVPMRDGVRLYVDVYRPDAPGKFPALLAFAIYNKDFQGPEMNEALPAQPAWSPLWSGPLEAGDTHFFVSRGYVHVIGGPRGVGKSEGGGPRDMGLLRPDRMDRAAAVVRRQCRHGRHLRLRRRAVRGGASSSRRISRRSSRSIRAAPMASSAGSARNIPGGVVHLFRYLRRAFLGDASAPRPAGPAAARARGALARGDENPDYRMYPHVYN